MGPLYRRCVLAVEQHPRGTAGIFSKLTPNEFDLTFTMDFSKVSVPFLDVTVSVDQDGNLTSTLFRKETAGNTILKFSSSHPAPLHRAIPFGQYLRLRRICCNKEDFLQEASGLQERLLQRGYSHCLLKKGL